MLLLTIRNLRANKIRLALTAFAVVLGVSFVVSAFVLTDGLRRSFSDLSADIIGTTDLEVRPTSEFGEPVPFDASLLDTVAAVDGVDVAAGQVVGEDVVPVRPDGTPLPQGGPPLFGFSWVDDPGLSTFTVIDGRAPEAGMEFAMDETTATDEGFVLGQSYEVITATGRHQLQLVGITRFGQNNDTLGAVLTQYPLDTAWTLFGSTGTYDTIMVDLDDSTDAASAIAALEPIVPQNVEVLDREALVDDTEAGFDQGINILNNVLLGFAAVSLFVSIFIIANTFAIVFGQRTRDMAMLRAIGASTSQVLRSSMAEAAILGVAASLVGIAGGVGLALGLEGLFSLIGAGLPESPLVISARTIIAALVVGVGVTIASAIGPARRAAGVAPMAAIAASMDRPAGVETRRTIAGVALTAAGVALGWFGLFGDPGGVAPTLAAIGFGAIAVFLGVVMAGSAIVGPLLRTMGRPVRWLGMSGVLANENAVRQPNRTTSTAASLTVGLALVTMALVVGQSFKQGIGDTLESAVRADYVSNTNGDISPAFTSDLASRSEFEHVAGYRYTEFAVDGSVEPVIGTDLVATNELFDLDVVDGTMTNDAGTVTVLQAEADSRGLAVGDSIDVEYPNGATETLTVAAIFADPTVVDLPYVLPLIEWDERFGSMGDVWVAATVADGVDTAEAEAAIDELTAVHPNVELQTRDTFQNAVEGEIDAMLIAINAMLVLAALIALIGIANTLALSVVERGREIGLLRAVGMTRRQTRRMVRWESVQIALYGAIVGVALGVGFGWAVVAALPTEFAASFSVPMMRVALLVVVCAAAGIVAAALPARRAARLDVLDAIGV